MRAASWSAGTSFAGALLTTTCCALPSLLVALGLGSAVAGAVAAVPGLSLLSGHKEWLFVVVGVVLVFAWATLTGRVPIAWLRARVCPVGAVPHGVRRLWQVSLGLYALSLVVAYLGAPIARLLLESSP